MTALSVFRPRRFARLIAADAMNVSRDPMLIFATVLSVTPSIGLWLTRDLIDDSAFQAAGITELSRYIVPVALLLPAFLIGWVTGFLLLEDRDDGPLLAVDVTPVGKTGFLAYRLAVTALLTAAITLGALQLLLPELDLWLKLLILVLIPADAALSAIVLLAVARNKVEGLALTKLINIASIVPLIAIIPSPWRLLAGVVPTYWLGELLDLSGEAILPAVVVAFAAVAIHLVMAAGLLILLRLHVG